MAVDSALFIQQCLVLPITNSIILGSDFLDTHFAILAIGDRIINLRCTDYMLTTSLTQNPEHNLHLAKIVTPAATEISYKQFRKEIQKYTLTYITIVQHRFKFPLPLSVQPMLKALL